MSPDSGAIGLWPRFSGNRKFLGTEGGSTAHERTCITTGHVAVWYVCVHLMLRESANYYPRQLYKAVKPHKFASGASVMIAESRFGIR